MTASFGRAFPGLGLAACVQHCLPTRVTVGLPQRHAAYLQAFRQLGAHRSVGHLSMTKEQIALEPLQGNHSVATMWPLCGGATVVFFPPGDPTLSNARCSNLGCTTLPLRPLETLHHLFFECAPCHRALEWLCHLWGLIDPEHPAPPMLPHVLLADDQVTWAPPQQLSSLWNLLRLTMLKRIWIGRCAAVAAGDGPSQASTPAIVCAFIREIRSLMQQDWLRVEGDVRQLGGVCPSWFRGRDPSLPLQRFQSWWCAEDVLASTQLVVGGQPRMVLKLSRFSVPGMPPLVTFPRGVIYDPRSTAAS